MATAKRKQEELGEDCDDHDQHETDPCSDDDDAKRPRLDLHPLQHQLHHHQLQRQWSEERGVTTETCARVHDDCSESNDSPADFDRTSSRDTFEQPLPLTYGSHDPANVESGSQNYYFNIKPFYNDRSYGGNEGFDDAPCDLTKYNQEDKHYSGRVESSQREEEEVDRDQEEDPEQPINFAYYHF